ncbi:MAG: hypothetical protein LBD59_03255 [Prevotellaceae bacterium]|jgi:hypothetical protein|nr:hypothetical protein [Prevotellaceae bacterium]
MNKEEFTELVKTDKDAIAFRGGRTPLFSLPTTSALAPELVPILSALDLSVFNEEEMKTLNTFIFLANLPKWKNPE